MKVPFLDLKLQYESIKDEINTALQNVLDKTAFASGPYVKKFEEEFAEFCQCKYAVGVNSGTSALWLTLIGFGIGQGDEVITAPNTFIATVEAISMCGATPVFVDIDKKTYNMNPQLLENAITSKTKAIIPVHLFGQMADMDPIMEIAKKHGLLVIEDASQAHGAEYHGKRAGSIGDAGCFSFYPGKNLGAYGEAGAVVSNGFEIAETVRMLRDHGQEKKYYHSLIGWNARMDGFQGAVLSVKLKHLDQWNEARQNHAQRYNTLLKNMNGIITPQQVNDSKHVYHIYAILAQKRDDLIKSLAEEEIYCGIHYPIPVHLTDAYQFLGLKKNSYPITEKYADQLISLPIYPELTSGQIERVVSVLYKFLL